VGLSNAYMYPPQSSPRHTHVFNMQRLRCLLKCVFSLSEEEAQVLAYLVVNEKGGIAKDIAEALRRNPEVVRRALRSLYSRSLVVRRPYPLRRGGRAYLYQASPGLARNIVKVCEQVEGLVSRVKRSGRQPSTA
jgi:predicted transcriptional regulator